MRCTVSTNALTIIARFSPKINKYASDNYEYKQARDGLGYLLYKNPDRAQSFELSFGKALTSFTPKATPGRHTAALLMDVDPVAFIRTRRGPSGDGGALDQYVNGRPWMASLDEVSREVYLFFRGHHFGERGF